MEPIEVIDREGGKAEVRVHQLVKSLGGDVLSDSEVWHVHTIANGLIEHMDLEESDANADMAPSAAFAKHYLVVETLSTARSNTRRCGVQETNPCRVE